MSAHRHTHQDTNHAVAIDEALVEQIVSEVVRRLTGAGGSCAAKPGQASAKTPPASENTRSSSQREHRLDARLITIESLRAIPDDCQTLRIAGKAIVTPAVIDELRDRGVQLIRGSDPANQATTASAASGTPAAAKHLGLGKPAAKLTIARVDGADGPGWDLVRQLGHATVNGGLASVVARLKSYLRDGGRGVLVTSAPATAVYSACRVGLRPVYGGKQDQVVDAVESFDANLLVLDGDNASIDLVNAFLHTKFH